MRIKNNNSNVGNSSRNNSANKKSLNFYRENKFKKDNNIVNNSSDSVINNSNNDILDDIEDIDEEHYFHMPINESHRFFSGKAQFGKTYINSIPLKRVLVPKSKSPNIKNHGHTRGRTVPRKKHTNLQKSQTSINKLFSLNKEFLHCRNCMLIIAMGRYGKYYFNK